jgi:cell division initiation protein
MEISAKVLREVEFSGSLRGYNTDEVDEFLEQVALAVDRLQSETRVSVERVENERAGRDRSEIEDEESIRRTLVLAQRTADLAIREAQEEAALLMDRTRAEAESVINEAHEVAEQLATEAAQQLRDDVERLTALRESLRAETDNLVRLLDAERSRITESLSSALRSVERTLTPPAAIVSPDASAPGFAGTGEEAPFVLDDGGGDGGTSHPGGFEPSPDSEPDEPGYGTGDQISLDDERQEGSPRRSSGFDDLEANIAEDAAAAAPVSKPVSAEYDWQPVSVARSSAMTNEGSEYERVGLTAMPSMNDPKDAGRRRPFRRRAEW